MGTPISKGTGVEAILPKMARVSQEWPWMTREWPWVSMWGRASVGASSRMSQVVKLVMELYHVSQGGKQGEFRDSRASVWASPCEYWW